MRGVLRASTIRLPRPRPMHTAWALQPAPLGFLDDQGFDLATGPQGHRLYVPTRKAPDFAGVLVQR